EGKERDFKVKLGSLAGAVSSAELLPGVTAEPLDDEARRQIGAPRDLEGLVITEIKEDSEYARRLAVGMVVVEVNREAVSDLETAQGLLKPGRNLLIVYIRGMFTPIAVTVK
ncbi:MAG: protease Do, partial [Burkholderiales bacterium]|nr:protease Do [Opitutaceae bacterium]